MSGEADWDNVWELARAVLENGAPLNLTDETRTLLLRVAQEVALSKQDAEDALRSVPAAKTLLREIDRRIHEGAWRLTDARNRAKKLRDEGAFDGAQQALRDMLAVEVVPHYREQAEITLASLIGLAQVYATGQLNPNLHDRQQLAALALRVQQGHALELTEDLRALLRRTAPTAAISETDTEEDLKSPEGAEALMGRVLSLFRESERRFLDSMYRMTRLRDAGHLEGARQQMRDVLAVEVVPQYRRMAEEQLKGLDGPP
ncbi:MAG: DUSAM domain-containing protein [Cystobacter sp.]